MQVMNYCPQEDRLIESLHNRDLSKNMDNCGWDKQLKFIVHRFNLGQRRCRCTKIVLEKNVYKGGWKREKDNNNEDKSKEI